MKRIALLLMFLCLPSLARAQQKKALSAASSTCTTTSCLTVTVDPTQGGATFTISANPSGNTIVFEASGDGGSTVVAISATPSNSSTSATSTTSTGTWQVNTSGYTNLYLRMSTLVGGTTTVSIIQGLPSARGGSGGGGGGGGGTVTGCTTAGGVAYENGTNNTLTCEVGMQYNNSTRNEFLLGKGVKNIVDSGQAGVSFINPLAASNTFGLLESTSTDGGFALSFAQAGRPAGGMTLQGAGSSGVPGALENGVFGIIDPNSVTEIEFIPDSGSVLFGPHNANFLNWTTGGTTTIVASAGLSDTTSTFSLDATNGTTTQVEEDFNFANGTWTLFTGLMAQAISVDASQNAKFSAAIEPSSGHVLISSTAPTVSSGFGTGASVTANNGSAAFRLNVGTSNTGTGVVSLPTATTGWNCYATDITTKSTLVAATLQTASTTASATFQNYTDIVGTHAWVDSDVLAISCFAY